MSNFGIFYDARSPNMTMSRDPRSKFQTFLSFPNSAFNIRKSYKISSKKFSSSEVISQKSHGGWNPSAFRVSLARQGTPVNETSFTMNESMEKIFSIQ